MSNVSFGGRKMLNQSSAVKNIQDLQTAADGKNRQIVLERTGDEVNLDGVALIIGRLCFGLRGFAV